MPALVLRPDLFRSSPARHQPLSPVVVTAAIFIVILNLVDAFGTLRNVARGAEEINPVMAHLLDLGPLWFFVGKFLLAGGGVVGIVACGRRRAAKVALCYVLMPLYLLVAFYQVALLVLI